MMIQSGSIQWSLCNLIRYTVPVGLAVGQRDDRTKRLIKVSSTGEEVQNFLALETSEGFSQGLNCEHPTRQIRAVSFHPHIRTLFSYWWWWFSRQVVSDSFDPMDCSLSGSSVHGDSPYKNTGVGCHALLQGIFPTQGLNPGLPHCGQILSHLSHQGSWVLGTRIRVEVSSPVRKLLL